jgi:NAD(P)H-dependent FMN reductase
MIRIGIILGSTRFHRVGDQVAGWVLATGSRRDDAVFELVDLRDFPLPHFDEQFPPAAGRYQHEHTKEWARAIASFDGYVIVTPEYNHSVPGVLKNALDHLYAEWADKAVGFVSYGAAGGVRAVEHLRAICGNLHLADVRRQVTLRSETEFDDRAGFRPGDRHTEALRTMLDQVVSWSTALAPLRTATSASS